MDYSVYAYIFMNVHKSAKNLHVYRTMNGSTHCGVKKFNRFEMGELSFIFKIILHILVCRIETQISSINQVKFELNIKIAEISNALWFCTAQSTLFVKPRTEANFLN